MQTQPNDQPYQFSHHTAEGLAVYVDAPEVMHRIAAPVAAKKKPDPRLTDVRYCLFRFFIADSYGIAPEVWARAELAKEFRIANRTKRNGKFSEFAKHALSRANRQLWAARNQDAICAAERGWVA